MVQAHFTLSNGAKIPSLGLGTWQSGPGEVARAVEAAIKAGYRHIDCAWGYDNEAEVGEGIKASGVPRSELWITSKLFETHHRPEHVELAIKDTLSKLGTDYLDLYLMHWNICWEMNTPPGQVPQKSEAVRGSSGKIKLDLPLCEDVLPTYRELEKLVGKGLTKNIGVSNFNINRIKKLLPQVKIKPVVNQVEISIQCPQPELVEYCKKNDILVCAYSPLGGTAGTYLREHKIVASIAEKYDVHGATILLSWLIKRGICPLPKSVTASRIAANFKTVDLTEQEFEEIEKLAESHPSKRLCDQTGSYEPYYDIFQESDPELNDKAQWAKELKA